MKVKTKATILIIALLSFIFLMQTLSKKEISLKNDASRAEHFNIQYNGISYQVFRINHKETSLRAFWKNEEGKIIGSLSKLKKHINKNNQELLWAMNAGIFDQQQKPLGLYIENGIEKNPINLNDGSGNFFLKPNGIFIITPEKAEVINSKSYSEDSNTTLAIQSGPLLVENNQIHSAFNLNSKNQFIRNGVGVDKNGIIWFAISDEPTNLYSFANLFKEKLNCPNALYLDGAISEVYYPKKSLTQNKNNFSVIFGVTK